MQVADDFRAYAFDLGRVDAAGKNIGQKVYWKLYVIENLVRVMAHSILTAQIGANWWDVAVDPRIKARVEQRKSEYATRPWHSKPGQHNIYYALLSDLSKIITANSHLFRPVVPDIDNWIAHIEQVRLPRNIVGHMNWPHKIDRKRIEVLHADLHHLVNQLAVSGTGFNIP